MKLLEILKRKSSLYQGVTQQHITEFALSKRISLAQSSVVLDVAHSPCIKDLVPKMAKKEINPRNQQGFLFEDGSVLIQVNGLFTGLNIDQSSLWQRGLGHEPFNIQKYEEGQKITLRSATYFEVVDFKPRTEHPLILKIAGKGLISYSSLGVSGDPDSSDFDILMVPQTEPIFYLDSPVVKKPNPPKTTLS